MVSVKPRWKFDGGSDGSNTPQGALSQGRLELFVAHSE